MDFLNNKYTTSEFHNGALVGFLDDDGCIIEATFMYFENTVNQICTEDGKTKLLTNPVAVIRCNDCVMRVAKDRLI